MTKNQPVKTFRQDHWIPDQDDWPDCQLAVQTLLTIPTERLEYNVTKSNRREPFSCEWQHYDVQGALTREVFEDKLAEACAHFARTANQTFEMLRTYPIINNPQTALRLSWHEWKGSDRQFDMFCQMMWHSALEVPGHDILSCGFNFELAVLIPQGSADA